MDATNIERNLYLTMQLMELDIPMVLALNMMDEVMNNGGTIQVNRLHVSPADYTRALARAEIPFREVPDLPGCVELEGGSAVALPGFDQGLFYVQDRAARTAVEIAAPRPGVQVLDACSCPGGKSFAAAIAMENRGSILACDIHEKKLAVKFFLFQCLNDLATGMKNLCCPFINRKKCISNDLIKIVNKGFIFI